jgi:hypothetical protein
MGVDPDQYIAFQSEFILHYRETLKQKSKEIGYREYLEKDQMLTTIEKFVNSLEKERLQQLQESKVK